MAFFNPTQRVLLVLLAVLGLTSCGGGGDGDRANAIQQAAAAPPAAAQALEDGTGVVGILIKDAPTLDFTRIILNITRVELLGNGDPQVLFEGDKTIDLLQLQNYYDVLALSDQVPVGEYDKIRLRVNSITLYCLDDNDVEVSEEADVPANGKIDLNPRAPFTVAADTALLIEIDMDAKKSIKVHTTGTNRYKFRPVVFVDIEQREAVNGLIRVSGEIRNIDTDAAVLELCNLDIQFTTDLDHCLLVNASVRNASVFDENGDPIPFENLTITQTVTVFGVAVIVTPGGPRDDSDDDTVRMIQVDAVVIQRGDPANMLSLDGEASTPVDGDGMFVFDVAQGQDFPDGALDVLVQPETRILSGEGLAELDDTAIQPGVIAEVSGVIPDETLKSVLILIDPDGEVREQRNGLINLLGDTDFSISLAGEDPPVTLCIEPVADARYFQLIESTDGTEINEVTFDFLELNQEVSVFGTDPGAGGCFDADVTIVIEDDT